MRVLVVPELYRPGDASSSGTLSDAVTWVEQWLRRDERLHVYWLLPPRERAGYDRADAPVERALDDLAGTSDAGFALDELVARTAEYTADGRPVTDRETYSRTDALYALRNLGYEDSGAGEPPEFVRTGRWA
ncbi:hypothetical protein [Halomicrococcus sp. SG-WS-1]|uniref:hypothetical protein n=1 Tax=Halomicrococcus sp. SG-WS-1 TaxID=3439057 RepID=UPI003F79024E